MKLVIDASVAFKWVLPERPYEADVESAMEVLAAVAAGSIEALQPPHWFGEVLATVARLDRSRIERTVQLLTAMPKRIVENESIYLRAGHIAADLNHHLFDTLYHATALESGAMFLTADEKYYAKAVHLGALQRLAEFQP